MTKFGAAPESVEVCTAQTQSVMEIDAQTPVNGTAPSVVVEKPVVAEEPSVLVEDAQDKSSDNSTSSKKKRPACNSDDVAIMTFTSNKRGCEELVRCIHEGKIFHVNPTELIVTNSKTSMDVFSSAAPVKPQVTPASTVPTVEPLPACIAVYAVNEALMGGGVKLRYSTKSKSQTFMAAIRENLAKTPNHCSVSICAHKSDETVVTPEDVRAGNCWFYLSCGVDRHVLPLTKNRGNKKAVSVYYGTQPVHTLLAMTSSVVQDDSGVVQARTDCGRSIELVFPTTKRFKSFYLHRRDAPHISSPCFVRLCGSSAYVSFNPPDTPGYFKITVGIAKKFTSTTKSDVMTPSMGPSETLIKTPADQTDDSAPVPVVKTPVVAPKRVTVFKTNRQVMDDDVDSSDEAMECDDEETSDPDSHVEVGEDLAATATDDEFEEDDEETAEDREFINDEEEDVSEIDSDEEVVPVKKPIRLKIIAKNSQKDAGSITKAPKKSKKCARQLSDSDSEDEEVPPTNPPASNKTIKKELFKNSGEDKENAPPTSAQSKKRLSDEPADLQSKGGKKRRVIRPLSDTESDEDESE